MRKQSPVLAAVLLMVGLMSAGDVWSAQAGRVQFVHGDVQVTSAAGQVHAMRKGEAVNEGDTVVSAQDASAQIKMRDGGFVAIRPDTRLKFDSFKFSAKQDEPESAFFSLFKGGFRAITGLIGRIRHQDYHITTPVATIGIRGTDHETVMVLPNNPLVATGQAQPGVYNKVNVGETSITTDKGTVNVLPNQMGFAGGLNQTPQIQPLNTSLFTVAPAPSPGAKMDDGGGSGGDSGTRDTTVVDANAEAAGGQGNTSTTTSSTNASVLASTAPPSVVVTPTQALAQTSLSGGMGLFYTGANSTTWTTGGGGTIAPKLDSSGGLSGFTVTFGSCIANCQYNIGFTGGSRGTASLLENGGYAAAGNMHWGRWFGSGATINGLPAGDTIYNSNLTYIGGDAPTMPVSGMANYVPIGGTSPVDAAGTKGTFIGATIGVDFTASHLTVSNMKVLFPTGTYAGTYTMAGSGTFLSNGVIPSIPIGGSCSGQCGTSVAATGDVAGSFTGANAAGLALGYHISTSGQTTGAPPAFEMMGAQGFVKQ